MSVITSLAIGTLLRKYNCNRWITPFLSRKTEVGRFLLRKIIDRPKEKSTQPSKYPNDLPL